MTKERVISILISLGVGFVIGLPLGFTLIALSCGLLAVLVTEYLLELWFIQPKERRELSKKIENKLDNIIQYTVFFTENNTLEKSLAPLSNPNFGKAKWLVAKFISKKLSSDFKVGTMIKAVNALDYSTFARELIKECEQSIYLTISFVPYAWFKKLLEKSQYEGELQEILGGNLTDIKYFPHLNELKKNEHAIKKRLCILEEQEWMAMLNGGTFENTTINTNQAQNCLREFIRLNDEAGVEIRFVKIDLFPSTYNQFLNTLDLKNTDYGIYEDKILIGWKIANADMGDLWLETDSKNFQELINMFNFNKAELKSIYFTKKRILELLK